MAGSLYVVATPIGNLDDMTIRAVNTLKSVALVAAEDTRRTGLLLRHFGITTRTTSLHAHNEAEKLPVLLRKLAAGVDVALVSDAGTPVVSDPGQRLIAAAAGQGVAVIPIPGPSAVLAALAASGYPADEFVFAGFAPAKAAVRKDWLQGLSRDPRTIVFFEAPHRISAMLNEIRDISVERPICLMRELTKIHEEIVRSTTSKATLLNVTEKGEFTVVLGPFVPVRDGASTPVNDEELSARFSQMIYNVGGIRRRAAAALAAEFGLSTNEVYRRLERFKASDPS